MCIPSCTFILAKHRDILFHRKPLANCIFCSNHWIPLQQNGRNQRKWKGGVGSGSRWPPVCPWLQGARREAHPGQSSGQKQGQGWQQETHKRWKARVRQITATTQMTRLKVQVPSKVTLEWKCQQKKQDTEAKWHVQECTSTIMRSFLPSLELHKIMCSVLTTPTPALRFTTYSPSSTKIIKRNTRARKLMHPSSWLPVEWQAKEYKFPVCHTMGKLAVRRRFHGPH